VLFLKRLILGENPCNVDKLFRRMKQYGWHSHQGGGVSGIEIALWDISGKAYGVPVWQMLGGKFRDRVRLYCDTDVDGKPDGKRMGNVLKQRIKEKGYTFMKMDLSADELLADIPGALNCPVGFYKEYYDSRYSAWTEPYAPDAGISREEKIKLQVERQRKIDVFSIPGTNTGIHITETGFDFLEQYAKDIRDIVGYEIPIATDHFGHIGLGDCIKLAARLDKYNFAWYEDMLPWQMADHLAEISRHSATPVCTGEDIYLKENFIPILEKRAVSIIHPDLCSVGGILEAKKVGDLAQGYNVPMAIHMNETPIAAMAAVQVAASTENFFVMEFHHNDHPWWPELVKTRSGNIIENGYINVPDEPGIGIERLNDDVLREYQHIKHPDGRLWRGTEEWDFWMGIDQLWL
jgi:L-alanine-DL-glutamate epimerase-like enolase superfamily enzyme